MFHGKGPAALRRELEIDNGGTVNNNAQKLLDIANASAENLYIKTDGSLMMVWNLSHTLWRWNTI